ncbi:DoxX family protein [Flavobacterium subsaxonicum]|uniref:DoxX family protein n=1 Tax=Flavobacterium subsaxonicum WB 4.1-42 = DSM 21790 TaxID=1121898 RepID=A0A0A2ML82_9FLAO|nr:DoxX family membrane protein [Flavobacterium subsaxonicum]KGO93417.1 DoxX family protein [Flavobacterium subsaxonicum WB 4.1-42 = DSM 21790]
MTLPWHLYLMAAIYILAGLNHFRVPKIYTRMIPPSFPNPKALNILSGLAEFLLGIALCIPAVSTYAAWGIIVLLVAVFPANVFMYTNDRAGMGLPKWVRLVRLPLQILLILWAYLYT